MDSTTVVATSSPRIARSTNSTVAGVSEAVLTDCPLAHCPSDCISACTQKAMSLRERLWSAPEAKVVLLSNSGLLVGAIQLRSVRRELQAGWCRPKCAPARRRVECAPEGCLPLHV